MRNEKERNSFSSSGWSFPTSEKRERCERDITFIKISNARDITLSIRVQYFFYNR